MPRAKVLRAVVGSRTGADVLGVPNDWGIARIDTFLDAAGLDLTPLPLLKTNPEVGTPLVNPSYMRHHFPFDDNDAETWNNMEFDRAQCGRFFPKTGGMWAVTARPPPNIAPSTPDQQWCNARWNSGFVNASCSVKSASGDLVLNDCSTAGGSSGSPMMFQDANNSNSWTVLGLTHGGGDDHWELNGPPPNVPTCTDPTDSARWDNGGPASVRFADAPRFASNVAVHRSPGRKFATAVFAVDSDRNQVVYRTRGGGATPTYSDPFGPWQSLGAPIPWTSQLSRIAACQVGLGNEPRVFVIGDGNKIFTRESQPLLGWTFLWQTVSLPTGVSTVADLDTTTGPDGQCLLLMTDANGSVFSRVMQAPAKPWVKVMSGSHRSVSGIRVDNQTWVATIDAAGDIWRSRLNGATWTAPLRLPRLNGVAPWADLDFTWDEAGRGFLVAITTNADPVLRFMPLYGNDAWVAWRQFETDLWAPGSDRRAPVPRMVSITASRWSEDPNGVTSPVIFATDDAGNIYFIEFARVSNVGWNLHWKSFYNDRIPYP